VYRLILTNLIPEAYSILNSIVNSAPVVGDTLFTRAANLIQNGFYNGPILNFESQFTAGDDGVVSPPSTTEILYPAGAADAPFTISEMDLLAAIRIPLGFTFGKKPPVILVPGTGSTGYLTYAANYLKLLRDVDFADPVYLNVPHFLLDDAQLNSVSPARLSS
jgi:hypothetical protein